MVEENCPPSMRTPMVPEEEVWGGRNASMLILNQNYGLIEWEKKVERHLTYQKSMVGAD